MYISLLYIEGTLRLAKETFVMYNFVRELEDIGELSYTDYSPLASYIVRMKNYLLLNIKFP